MKPTYGIIGNPLEQSFSPKYFAQKFEEEGINDEYCSFTLSDISHIVKLTKQYPTLKGLNVTIPFKIKVIPYLNHLDYSAKAVGAVNCIAIREGKLTGFNTDIVGFQRTLVPLLLPHHTRCLILGTGGASLGVKHVLRQLSLEYTSVSRYKGEHAINYDDVSIQCIQEHSVIINTTPLGMFPNITSFPDIPYKAISDKHLLYDLVYNPLETSFLSFGKARGASVKNGLEMLQVQADAAWAIWNTKSY